MFLAMPPDGFKYTKGSPKQFTRKDLEKPVTREFCAECGTHLITRPRVPVVVIKVGTSTIRACSAARRSRSTPSTSSRSTMFPKACRRSSVCRSARSGDRLQGRTDINLALSRRNIISRETRTGLSYCPEIRSEIVVSRSDRSSLASQYARPKLPKSLSTR
jgi:Glutathione-dependent formaldehyde-activating enzyme